MTEVTVSEVDLEPRAQDTGSLMALGANVVLNLPQLADKLLHLAQQPEPEKIPGWAACVGGLALTAGVIWLVSRIKGSLGYEGMERYARREARRNESQPQSMTSAPLLSRREKRQEASRLKVGMREKTADITKKGFSLGGAQAFAASFESGESQRGKQAVEKNLLILGKDIDAQIDALVETGDFEGARQLAEKASGAVREIDYQMKKHPSERAWKARLGH